MKANKNRKISSRKKKQVKKAKRDFNKMWEEIKPFLKERKIINYSTAGTWRVLDYNTAKKEVKTN